MSINTIFKERIKFLVGNDSAAAFGKKCGIDGKTVTKAMKGHLPGAKVLYKISGATGRPVEWLLGTKSEEQGMQVTEPPDARTIYELSTRYEQLKYRFQHIFDFLIETYEGDSIALNDFMEALEKDFMLANPDYRLWLYKRRAAAEERSKKTEEKG
jgi:transcriptional regulator with XRE-family HTH domain